MVTLRHVSMTVAAVIAVSGCSSAPAEEEALLASTVSDVTACPTPGSTDDQLRAAATLAFNLMRLAAKTGGPVAPVYANTILAAQRYKVRSSGTGIEFRSTDKLYSYVTSEMKALLEFAQDDASLAKLLSDGQLAAYKTNGWYFPSVNAISALANFTRPGPTTAAIADLSSANNSHKATVTATNWCGNDKILITETVQRTYSFSPLQKRQITNAPGNLSNGPVGDWLTHPPAEFANPTNSPTAGNTLPSTPFNGPSTNPYLVISLTSKGVTTSWATYDWSSDNCYNYSYPTFQCTGYLELDPIPYTEPGSFFNVTGLVGTQANPFVIDSVYLYAAADHQGQWATRTVNGVQEYGTFSTPVTKLGLTLFRYAKRY